MPNENSREEQNELGVKVLKQTIRDFALMKGIGKEKDIQDIVALVTHKAHKEIKNILMKDRRITDYIKMDTEYTMEEIINLLAEFHLNTNPENILNAFSNMKNYKDEAKKAIPTLSTHQDTIYLSYYGENDKQLGSDHISVVTGEPVMKVH